MGIPFYETLNFLSAKNLGTGARYRNYGPRNILQPSWAKQWSTRFNKAFNRKYGSTFRATGQGLNATLNRLATRTNRIIIKRVTQAVRAAKVPKPWQPIVVTAIIIATKELGEHWVTTIGKGKLDDFLDNILQHNSRYASMAPWERKKKREQIKRIARTQYRYARRNYYNG
tara:strand:+ start:256 stop:768 length:513 start_codon:yes stop_codon:yes gene_type:complete